MEAIQWDRMMVEFDQMKEFDQLRAVNKEQMEWLTEVAEKDEFLFYPGQIEAAEYGFETWKPNLS